MNNNRLKVEILKDSNKILDNLHKGISIPILPEFHKYILNDLEIYNAKALIIKKTPEIDYFGE